MRSTETLEKNGAAVRAFGLDMHNVVNTLKLSGIAEHLVAMFQSGQWRAYVHNRGPVRWRAAEFDYFLMAEGVRFEDVSQIAARSRAGALLAPGFVSNDPRQRRPLAAAASTWPSDTGESLEARGRRLGWLPPRATAPTSPISSYARAVARDALPLGTRAVAYKLRNAVAALPATRRRELDALVARLTAGLTDNELRYVRARIGKRGKGRPAGSHAHWRADVDELNGNTRALMKHGGLTKRGAENRRATLK